eukprot:9503911-Pyramimonas_sp.AAC.3
MAKQHLHEQPAALANAEELLDRQPQTPQALGPDCQETTLREAEPKELRVVAGRLPVVDDESQLLELAAHAVAVAARAAGLRTHHEGVAHVAGGHGGLSMPRLPPGLTVLDEAARREAAEADAAPMGALAQVEGPREAHGQHAQTRRDRLPRTSRQVGDPAVQRHPRAQARQGEAPDHVRRNQHVRESRLQAPRGDEDLLIRLQRARKPKEYASASKGQTRNHS